jgi:DnaJ-class molecular chaperone
MNISQALQILEIDSDIDESLFKEQYRWLVKFYHPDNKITGNSKELMKVISAEKLVRQQLGYH